MNYEQAMELALFAARKMRALNGYTTEAGGSIRPRHYLHRDSAAQPAIGRNARPQRATLSRYTPWYG